MLFNYRGEVIPSLALQAFSSTLRQHSNETEVQSQVGYPYRAAQRRKIPIIGMAQLMVNPNWVETSDSFHVE